jgi:hypothetical protein
MSFKATKRKGFNFFRSYYDVYNELEKDSDKLAFIEALLDRQFLGVSPENLTGMARFAWISQVNSIDSQVKGYEDKTGDKLTPTEGGRQGGVNTPTEQVEEKEKEKDKNIVAFSFKKALYELGVESKIANEYLKVRKAKKAINTETAFNSIKIQIEKTDLNANQIITKCVEMSWSGFKAEWLKDQTQPKRTKPPTYGY